MSDTAADVEGLCNSTTVQRWFALFIPTGPILITYMIPDKAEFRHLV